MLCFDAYRAGGKRHSTARSSPRTTESTFSRCVLTGRSAAGGEVARTPVRQRHPQFSARSSTFFCRTPAECACFLTRWKPAELRWRSWINRASIGWSMIATLPCKSGPAGIVGLGAESLTDPDHAVVYDEDGLMMQCAWCRVRTGRSCGL